MNKKVHIISHSKNSEHNPFPFLFKFLTREKHLSVASYMRPNWGSNSQHLP